MFRKLVSNLSFSPGVASQLVFYAKRLRAERFTRTLSLALGAGVLVLQFATILAPPTAVSADVNNDIIPNGIISQKDLITHIDGSPELQSLYHDKFGITDDDISRATYNGALPAKNSDKYSLGKVRHAPSDQVITTPYNTYYFRPLSSVATSDTGRAYVGTTSRGQWFAILLSCGNIVMASLPNPPPTPPAVDKPALGQLDIVDCNQIAGWAFDDSLPTTPISVDIYIDGKFNQRTTASQSRADVGAAYPGRGNSHGFSVPTPAIMKDGKQHTVAAYAIGVTTTGALNSANPWIGTKTVTLNCNPVVTPPPTVTPPPKVTPPPVVITPPPVIVPPPPPLPNINQSKFATYLSHKDGSTVATADKTTAKSSDVIEYTLKTSNTGDGTQKNYAVVEDLTDIMEYATVTNTGGGAMQGNSLVWPAIDISGRTTVTKTFQITVKDPVPATARTSSDAKSFDLCMDNVYGDLVHICVAAPPVKQVEVVSESLPQTGPGLGIGVVAGFIALLAYFYARNRQLQTEVSILRVDHNPGVSS
jgi:hypothetical protein